EQLLSTANDSVGQLGTLRVVQLGRPNSLSDRLQPFFAKMLNQPIWNKIPLTSQLMFLSQSASALVHQTDYPFGGPELLKHGSTRRDYCSRLPKDFTNLSITFASEAFRQTGD